MSYGMGDSAILVDVLKQHQASGGTVRFGAEIGVFRGEASAMLLRAFPDLRLLMIDPYETYPSDHPYRLSGDGCAKQSAAEQDSNYKSARLNTIFAAKRRQLLRMKSVDAAKSKGLLNCGYLDFAFIDGDHRLEAVREDIAAWWPHVAVGGLLAGHDWGHPRCRPGGPWGVDRAVCEFCNAELLELRTMGSVWWVKKPGAVK